MLQRHIRLLYLWILEFAVLFAFPFVSFFRLFVPMNKVTNHRSGKPTIIITEQWFVQTMSHIFMKRYFEKQKFRVYMFNFNPVQGGIDEGAYQLKKFIQKHKITNCILVGISLGAVTSYVYVQRFGGWQKVKKVFCMAAPFKGTPWANVISLCKSGKQIIPESDFVKQLAKEKIMFPERIICVVAKIDELVPRWSSVLAKAECREVGIVGHNNLHSLSKEVWELVVRESV